MSHLRSSKQHLALIVAVTTIGINAFIATRFVLFARQAMALQASESVRIPVASSKKDDAATGTLRITVRADGKVFVGETLIEKDSLGSFLRQKAVNRVTVVSDPNVSYDELKAFLMQLRECGVENVILSIRAPNP